MKSKALRILSLALVLVLGLTLFAGCQEQTDSATGFKAGTYEGSSKGFGGDITAKVTLSATAIDAIEVIADGETPEIGGTAIASLTDEILAKQTTAVEAIAGATVSSVAFIDAVNAALTSAGVDPASLKGTDAADSPKEDKTLDVDVVVIGGGGAGMTAAITAKQAGLNVIIVEKMSMLGGNTVKATGGMNAAETHYQKEQNVSDTVDTFVSDTMTGGYDINNSELVNILAKESSGAIDWLDSIGAPLPKISTSGGATNKRLHAPEDGSAVGPYLLNAFSEQIKALEIPVYFDTKAETILTDDTGAVIGITATGKDGNYTINSKLVILATGGFGSNEEMYTKYKPELKGFVTTNTPGATGDGIVMAEAVGASLVDIEQIQIHPTVEQTTSIMVTESVRGNGAILVNKTGERFIDEMQTRDKVSAAVIAQEEGYAYIIFDQKLREGLGAIESYVKSNIVSQGETIEDLAKAIEVDPATLTATLEAWNKAVADKSDAAFGRTTAMDVPLAQGPYYAIKIAPGVHHTMGGVRINESAQVLNANGDVIPGLLACGEVTGGIHGGNRLGGNAVADIVVFGRIAGKTAAEALK